MRRGCGNHGRGDLFHTCRPANLLKAAPCALHSRQTHPYRRGEGGRHSKHLHYGEDITMKRLRILVAAGLLLSWPALAHTPQQPPHQLYAEGDLKLESGEAIKDF